MQKKEKILAPHRQWLFSASPLHNNHVMLLLFSHLPSPLLGFTEYWLTSTFYEH